MDVGRITQGSGLPKDGPEQAPRPLQAGEILTAKVLATEGRTARVSVAGQTVDVQTSVPLAPGDELSLKVARGPGGQVQLQVMALRGKESLLGDAHVAELCEKMGLPTDKATVAAAKLLLRETGSAEPGQVRDLAKLLATLKTPDERAAATFLVARGLPASPAAIMLVAGRPGDPATAGKRLADRLEALRKAAPDLFAALAGLTLDEAGTEAGPTQDAQKLAEALARLAKGLNPLEAEILAFLKDRQGDLADRLSQNLSALLERLAEGEAASPQAKELNKEIRFQQLNDSATAARLNPAEVRIPLVFGNQTGDLTVEKWQGNAKDPAGHARVLLRLDMDHLGPLTVDLMYAKGQVGGRLTVGDAGTQEFLADRLEQLESSLGAVGVGVSHLEVGTAREAAAVEAPKGRFDMRM